MRAKDIGKIIKDRREELHLSQLDISKFVGVSESTVSRWESGFIANIKRNNIASLAKILQLSPIIFIDLVESIDEFSPMEATLLSDYRKLNKEGQIAANNTVKGLTMVPQYTIKEKHVNIFERQDIAMAASGLTPTTELSEHNQNVIAKHYNKDKR